jgi:hypothetical protein
MSSPRITLTHPQKREIRRKHDNTVVTALETRIETLNETLQWKSDLAECLPRFETTFEADGKQIAQLRFSAHNRNYRALSCWVPGADRFVVFAVVEKEEQYAGSTQHDLIDAIINDSGTVAQYCTKQVAPDNSG